MKEIINLDRKVRRGKEVSRNSRIMVADFFLNPIILIKKDLDNLETCYLMA